MYNLELIIKQIESSSTGEKIQNELIEGLIEFSKFTKHAITLNGHPIGDYVLKSEMNDFDTNLLLDAAPTEYSVRAVKSHNLYNIVNSINESLYSINGENVPDIDDDVILVSNIVITGKNKIIIGEKTKLEATVYPIKATNKKIGWISADKSIATIDREGVVTGLTRGIAIIYASAKDGSQIRGEHKIAIGNIKLVKTIKITLLNDVISVDISPKDADFQDVTWHSTNDSVFEVIDGTVHPKSTGAGYAYCVANDGSNVQSNWIKITFGESSQVDPSEYTSLTLGQWYTMGTFKTLTDPETGNSYIWNSETEEYEIFEVPISWMCVEDLGNGNYTMVAPFLDEGIPDYDDYTEWQDGNVVLKPDATGYRYLDMRNFADKAEGYNYEYSNAEKFYEDFSQAESSGGKRQDGVYDSVSAKNRVYLPTLAELGLTPEDVSEGRNVGSGYYWDAVTTYKNLEAEGHWLEQIFIGDPLYTIDDDYDDATGESRIAVYHGIGSDSYGQLAVAFNLDMTKCNVSANKEITLKGSDYTHLVVGQYYKIGYFKTMTDPETGESYVWDDELDRYKIWDDPNNPIYWMCAEDLGNGVYAMIAQGLEEGEYRISSDANASEYKYVNILTSNSVSLATRDDFYDTDYRDENDAKWFYSEFSSIEASGGRRVSDGVYDETAPQNGLYLPTLAEIGLEDSLEYDYGDGIKGSGYYWLAMTTPRVDQIHYVGTTTTYLSNPGYLIMYSSDWNISGDVVYDTFYDNGGLFCPVFNLDASKIDVSINKDITIKQS